MRRRPNPPAGDVLVVSLGDSRRPMNDIQVRVAEALRVGGPQTMTCLTRLVAAELYHECVARGGWVVDIGLLGPRVFERDVHEEIVTGVGVLWDLERTRGSTGMS